MFEIRFSDWLKSRMGWALPVLFFGIITAISAAYNVLQSEQHALEMASVRGRHMFKMIQLTRRWNALHGGVYAPVSEHTQPNPYLNDPKRDITSTEGLKLTKVNPAYMTRQISELSVKEGLVFHITSLNPIRPANAADSWESDALRQFEKGRMEATELITNSSGSVFRYMAPLLVEKACMRCHAQQGYHIGDIRGGISVNINSDEIIAYVSKQSQILLITHLTFFIFVSALSTFSFRRNRQYITDLNGLTNQLESRNAQLQDSQDHLEELVEERTHELSEANERLVTSDMQLIQLNNSLEERVVRRTLELNAAKEASESANIAKSEFLGNISHELRTPLHAILNFSSFGIKKIGSVSEEKIRSYFDNIDISTRRLIALVNELLDVTQFDTGQGELNYQQGDLRSVINDASKAKEDELKERGITLEIKDTNIDTTAIFDRKKIFQIVTNLLSNAITYSSDNQQIKILFDSAEITTDSSAGPAPAILFKVIDRGVGIPDDELESIFDKFVQSSKTRSGAGGTGLGLSISRQIIEKHGGTISAQNNPNGGSQFTVVIPRRSAD
ncbi:MAG: DUF3365 domain-containing protein [Chromatiales bacterium]|nr:DUF3365 domain-containing protein [Chromatiales bacterium]